TVKGFLVDPQKIPVQLCKGEAFRERLAGGNGQPSIIRRNDLAYGVPQGAPLSDLLANAYLLDFDIEMKVLAEGLAGRYLRYSDDILIIAPLTSDAALAVEQHARNAISRYGQALTIKESKSFIHHFENTGASQRMRAIKPADSNKGLEYLGFRFDGSYAYLRDKTLSSL